MMNRAYSYTIHQLRTNIPFTQVSENCNVSHTTVVRVFDNNQKTYYKRKIS